MADDLATLFAEGPRWVIGLMSGTSLDGVDAALIKTDGEQVAELGPWHLRPYRPDERRVLSAACDDAIAWGFSGSRPPSFAEATRILAHAHAKSVTELLSSPPAGGIAPLLIGFHGQTVLHRAAEDGRAGATLQLGDGPALARAVGVPVAHDFRSRDVEAGGQGAPLAPAYHAALTRLRGLEPPSAFLNIGGVANLTWCDGGAPVAFDTGPGNGPIDDWTAHFGYGAFDRNGSHAARGQVHEESVLRWLDNPYFDAPPPKSADRRDFPMSLASGLDFEDGAASLTMFVARSILMGLDLLPTRPDRIVVTGGGRHNTHLLRLLRRAEDICWIDAEDVGLRGDALEAEAFAYLAARSVRGLPLTYPTTTGVAAPLSGGLLAVPE